MEFRSEFKVSEDRLEARVDARDDGPSPTGRIAYAIETSVQVRGRCLYATARPSL